MRRLLSQAMQDADALVVQLDYQDAQGERTTRIVSPIRFLGTARFLGLCLCRCEPRQFSLERCNNIQLRRAADYVMPVEMKTVPELV